MPQFKYLCRQLMDTSLQENQHWVHIWAHDTTHRFVRADGFVLTSRTCFDTTLSLQRLEQICHVNFSCEESDSLLREPEKTLPGTTNFTPDIAAKHILVTC